MCLSHWSPPDSACIRHIPTAARPVCASHTGHLQTRLAVSTFLRQQGRHDLPHWLIFSHYYSSKVVICLSHWSLPDSACSQHIPTAARPSWPPTLVNLLTFLQQQSRHLPLTLVTFRLGLQSAHSYSSKAGMCFSHWSPPDSACIRHTPAAARPACAYHTGHLQTRLAVGTLLQQQGRHLPLTLANLLTFLQQQGRRVPPT